MLPMEILLDARLMLDLHVANDRPMPVWAARTLHTALGHLVELVAAMEAEHVAGRVLADDPGPHFPDLPTILPRAAVPVTRGGNVVMFPLQPRPRPSGERTISGCFRVIEGWPT